MPTIAFIGGGSAKFVSTLARDLFSFPALQDVHISLMDIDEERVTRSERLIQLLIREMGIPATVSATTDRRKALEGADYVIITIMVGGFNRYRSDGEIPMRYGVLPTVGDTIGPGGVFRLVRTYPVLVGIAEDLRQVAPHAQVLNYSNPMAMNTLALLDSGQTRTVGLCHSIQAAWVQLARWAGVPERQLAEVRYTAAGINHVNFYLTLEHRGVDLYQQILANLDDLIAANPKERCRLELLRYLGYFPAEGGYHQSEYSQWFRKDEATSAHYDLETMWGYHFDMQYNEELTRQTERRLAGEPIEEWSRSNEYGAHIIHALETGSPLVFYGNVANADLVTNLPRNSVVEVPCVADANGIRPCHVGDVPPQLASLQAQHIYCHQLALEGVKRKSRTLIRQAIQADPLTGAVLTLPRIAEMVDEMFANNAGYVTDWPVD